MFRKLFAPVLGLPGDTQTLALAAEIGTHFHTHIEVGIRGGSRGEEAPLDAAVVETLERWRHSHRLRLDPDGRHPALPATSWSAIAEGGIARCATYADLTCLAIDRSRVDETSAIVQSILFASGRPLLLVPVSASGLPSILGEPVVIGWNGTSEAVHAVQCALPFLEISQRIDIISIGEETVNAIEAYALARYLTHRRIRAEASGIAKKDWTGGDVIDAAVARGARLLVMGAHVRTDERRLGNATRHMLERIPIPVFMSA